LFAVGGDMVFSISASVGIKPLSVCNIVWNVGKWLSAVLPSIVFGIGSCHFEWIVDKNEGFLRSVAKANFYVKNSR
jgi:hypothetical protein